MGSVTSLILAAAEFWKSRRFKYSLTILYKFFSTSKIIIATILSRYITAQSPVEALQAGVGAEANVVQAFLLVWERPTALLSLLRLTTA